MLRSYCHQEIGAVFYQDACMLSPVSCVRLFITPGSVARQAPVHGDSPGKKTGVGCRFPLQGIFLTQGSN